LPLDSHNVVIDGGAYKGEWLDSVALQYGCFIESYEAVPEFAQHLSQRYARNSRISVHACALGSENGSAVIALADNGSTILPQRSRGASPSVQITTRDTRTELRRIAQQHPIGCVKLNVEGSEYEILESLERNEGFGVSKSWLVQFHHVDEASARRRQRIQDALTATHRCAWCFDFIWELWIRKE
jgi:FkbM family methyltransferase